MSLYTLKEHDGTYFKQRGDGILPVAQGNISFEILDNLFGYFHLIDSRREEGNEISETTFLKRLKFYKRNDYVCFYTEEVEQKIIKYRFNYFEEDCFLDDMRDQVIFISSKYTDVSWETNKKVGPLGILTKHQLEDYRRMQKRNEIFHIYDIKYKKFREKVASHFIDFYGKDNVYYTSNEDVLNIEVKRGDLYIQNLTAKHLLRDMYLRFTFSLSTTRFHNYARFKELKGTRLTITRNESSAYYIHSHLSNCTLGYWQPFCLGSSVVDSYFAIPLKYDDKEEWEDLFMHTEHLIGFEDTRNPYRRISRINTQLPDISDERSQSLGSDTFGQILQSLQIKLDTNGDYTHYTYKTSIDDLKISRYYLSVTIGDKEVSYDRYLRKLSDLDSYKTDKVVETTPSENKIFGEQVTCKIIDIENDIPEGLEPHLRPGVLKYISNKLDSQLINKIYEYNKHKEAEVTSN